MAKLSINEAAKRFDVSRPTLSKALKAGKISGTLDPVKGWQIDTAELVRVYPARGDNAKQALPAELSAFDNGLNDDLRRELESLKARLAVAEALAEERGKRLDQLVPLLAAPPRRRWWWSRRRAE